MRESDLLPIIPVPLTEPSRIASRPEQRLMLAVLEDAIDCFEKYYPTARGRANRVFREAEEWIMSDGYEGPFTFAHICSVLGLDPSAVRSRLRRAHLDHVLSGPRLHS